jgi:AraC family transcriptional regulator
MSNELATLNPVSLQPRFEPGNPLRIAGLTGHYTREQIVHIPEQWKRFVAYGEIPGRIGRTEYAWVGMVPDGCDYVSGCEVESEGSLPEGLVVVEVPARRYAIFPHETHVSQMPLTFQAIFDEWLPASGFQPDPDANGVAFCLERYGEAFNPQTGLGGIEIWLPVRDRA